MLFNSFIFMVDHIYNICMTIYISEKLLEKKLEENTLVTPMHA
jgi:hypothetical protein